jgi:N-acetylglucosaminyl-diphospho-decaprenol L-rhamnosyltransferase
VSVEQATSAPSLSVVVVSFRQGEGLRPALEALTAQLRAGDELIVVDNASGDATSEVARSAAPAARVIANTDNVGFPAACNLGAAEASGDLLVLLNHDAVVQGGWREAIARPLADGRGWTAWQALVTAEGGRIVNTRGGVVHFTGIAWAGGAGEPVGAVPETEPGFVSGACLALPRAEFERLGGFPPEFFLYHEDVDLSLRIRLAGGTLGVVPDARVDHEYAFEKGPAKWRYLERNRWATVLRTYPAPLLALVAPALLATEIALIPASIAGGWFPQKAKAWGDTLGALPRLVRERREIKRTRAVTSGAFAAALTPALDTPYLGAASRSRVLAALLGGYWRLVVRLLGRP